MSKRSTLLVAIGVAVFVLGAGVVLISLHAGKGGASKTEVGASGADVPGAVVVVTKPVAAGTTGESLIESKSVELRAVPKSEYSVADLTQLPALYGETLARPLAAGMPITAADLSLDTGPLAPPAGDQSLALTLSSGAAGIAGYLQPGSSVDVYANVTRGTSAPGASLQTPCVTLVATKIEVLDVSDEVPAYRSNPGGGARSVPGNITVLVGVTPAQAMKLAFYTSNESLYMSEANGSNTSVTGTCMGITNSTNLVPVS